MTEKVHGATRPTILRRLLPIAAVLLLAAVLVAPVAAETDYSTVESIALAKVTYGQVDNSNFWYIGRAPSTDEVYAYLDDKVLRIVGNGATQDFGNDAMPWFSLLNGDDPSELGVSVIYEEGITYVGAKHFRNCAAVQSVSFPSSILGIGEGFASFATIQKPLASNLKTVTFAENCKITQIGATSFWGCTNLTTIEIPANVKTIGYGTFKACSKLESVTFEEGSQIEEIGTTGNGNGAFAGCSSLTSITIPDTVKVLGSNALAGTMITEVTIPATVETMGTSCFNGCTLLEKVTFNTNQIKLIDEYVFASCTALKTIDIPDSVEEIKKMSFSNCASLTNINFGENSKLKTISGYGTFVGCTSLSEIELPASLEVIGANTFAYSSYSPATNVKIDFSTLSNLKSIGDNAFGGCINFGPVVRFPASLKEIGGGAFRADAGSGIRVVDLSHVGSDCTIGQYAFYNWDTMFYLSDPEGTVYTDNRKRAVAYTNGGVIPFEQAIDPDVLATPVKPDYTFGGWYDNAAFSGDAVTTVTSDKQTYYARWVSTINFDDGGAVLSDKQITVNETKPISSVSEGYQLPLLTRTDYTFNGWYTAKTDGVKITLETAPEGNATYYARWNSTIEFDPNGGTLDPNDDVEVVEGCDFTSISDGYKLPVPILTDYTFDGWHTKAGEKVSENTIPAGNATYTAKWLRNAGELTPAGMTVEKPTTESTKITAGGTVGIALSSDTTIVVITDSSSGITTTVEFAEDQTTNVGSGYAQGKIESVLVQYPESLMDATSGNTYSLTLSMKNLVANLPKINPAFNTAVKDQATKIDNNFVPVSMITAEASGSTTLDQINNNLSGTNNITITFTVPKSAIPYGIDNVYVMHMKDGKLVEKLSVTKIGETDTEYTFQAIGNSFSSYVLGVVKPVQQSTPSSSGSSGSSVWLMETQTPTPTPTVTPTETETAPTDIPVTQPTEAESPGFGVLAVLAGLGAVAVLRRK